MAPSLPPRQSHHHHHRHHPGGGGSSVSRGGGSAQSHRSCVLRLVRWCFLKDALLIAALGLFLVTVIQQISIIATNSKYERAQSAPTTNWQSRRHVRRLRASVFRQNSTTRRREQDVVVGLKRTHANNANNTTASLAATTQQISIIATDKKELSTSGELSEPVHLITAADCDDCEVILSDSSDTLPFRPSRRRYYVVSLDGVPGAPKESGGRLTRFRAYWNKYCKGVEFHECRGVLTEKLGSGVGLMTAYARCLRAALEDGFEQVIFLEDDARDFEQDHTFCQEHDKLFANSPAEALVILFGAHAFRTRYRSDVDTHLSTRLKLVRVSHSFGAYGFGLPSASAMHAVLRLFEEGKDRTTFPPDKEWYNLARNERWNIYAAEPLLIRHPEYAWSSTWNCKRRSAWAWNRRIISDEQAIAERAKVDPSVEPFQGPCEMDPVDDFFGLQDHPSLVVDTTIPWKSWAIDTAVAYDVSRDPDSNDFPFHLALP